jgi:hypothetical protein
VTIIHLWPSVARQLKRPTRGLGSATSSARTPGCPRARTASSYLALLRAEFAAFHIPVRAEPGPGYVSVALVLASRRTGVTRYPALRSSDFPRSHAPMGVASRSSGRVLYRGRSSGDDHPSLAAGYPTAQAADPRTGQRDLFRSNARLPEPPNRVLLFGLAPGRVCRVSPTALGLPRARLRLCGTGPRLAADGRYPLPCAEELGLSSHVGRNRTRALTL